MNILLEEEKQLQISKPKKIYFPATLVLFLGCSYIVAQISSILSNKSILFKISEGQVRFSFGEILQELRSYTYILIAILGGIQLLRSKKIGWILSFSFLLYMIIVMGGLLYLPIQMGMFELVTYIGFVFLFLIILATGIFLFKDVRTYYKIGPAQWLALLILSGILAASLFLS